MRDRVRRWRVRPVALLRAVGWRQRWRVEEAARRLLFPNRVGFVPRRLPPVAVTLPARPASGSPSRSAGASSRPRPRSARVGVAGGPEMVVADCARQAGLEVVCTEEPAAAGDLLGRAACEGWPVLALTGRRLAETPGGVVRTFLAAGGTLIVTGLEPSDTPALERLGEEIGVALPACRALPGRARGLRFDPEPRDLTRELAGAWFGSGEARAFLVTSSPPQGVLAWAEQDCGRWPVAWTAATSGGRVVLTTGVSVVADRSERKWRSPLSLLVPLMALRAACGELAWHAPLALANVTIDDPTLDRGLLGLDYDHLVRLAHDHDFHVTVATIPRELPLADPAVLELLCRERRRVTACYHGSDHDSYEFYLEGATRHRFRSQSLDVQRRKLSVAAARGSGFAEKTGYALDRVMVFPHGLCASSLLPALHDRGFLATCNAVDRYPLGSSGPPGETAGSWPADLEWSGFPLLGRRSLGAGELALDLFMGKPAIAFTHGPDVRPGLTPLLQHAEMLNGLPGVRLRWCGLEDLARHTHLIKRASRASAWDVLMTANEVCLHNPDATDRLYHVSRPHLPLGDHLHAIPEAGGPSDHGSAIDVVVPPGQTADVSVLRPANSGELHRPRAAAGCPLLEG